MMSDIPNWLKDAEQPSLSTAPTSSSSSPFSVSPSSATDRFIILGVATPTASSSSLTYPSSPPMACDNDGNKPSALVQKLGHGVFYVTSCLVLAIFIYLLTEQLGDNDDRRRFLWILFYSAHAALTVLYMFLRRRAWGHHARLFLSVTMLGFTGLMLWWAIADYQDVNDDDDRLVALRNVAGAAFGGVSIVYHHLLVWTCTARFDKEMDQ